ncbi:MAG TPA: TIGR00730 family Rossman fold protein, partial [Magnetospirillum sp.]|nr:TIGR00730 family Rossman fold protein [Magnetospirillum sp.]
MRRVCVFCGSSRGTNPAYAEAAAATGRLIAQRGLGLVYGGGDVGLMGIVANAALAAGGEVIGVIPDALMRMEVGNPNLTALHVVGTMHERKAMMAELSDGFIALPGGIGTLEELFEVWTWGQLGLHPKPLGLLDVAGYYDHLHAFLDHTVAEGFLKDRHRAMVAVDADPA